MNSSNCEGVKGAFFKIVGFACKRFLLSFPLPLHALFCARPNFPAAKNAKSASNVGKALPKRLLRRLPTFKIYTTSACILRGRNIFWTPRAERTTAGLMPLGLFLFIRICQNRTDKLNSQILQGGKIQYNSLAIFFHQSSRGSDLYCSRVLALITYMYSCKQEQTE